MIFNNAGKKKSLSLLFFLAFAFSGKSACNLCCTEAETDCEIACHIIVENAFGLVIIFAPFLSCPSDLQTARQSRASSKEQTVREREGVLGREGGR